MKEKINRFIHGKNFVIFLIVLLMVLIVATGTYAWFTWKSTNNTSLTMNIGKLADVTFTSGNDITTSTLAPVFNYTDGEKTTFSISNKDTSGTKISYDVNLNITSLPTELKSSDLKYVLLKDNTIVKEGNFTTITTGTNTIYSDTITTTGTTNFIFYLYIDGNNENSQSIINKTLSGTITLTGKEKETLATQITNLYNNASKTSVVNNSITYQYDTTNSLMKDVGNNIRYYGASPNNYIYFNCSDYSSQSSSTCEIWRIIGVFDDKIKLIRNESIGEIDYDNSNETAYLQSIDYNNNKTIVSLLSYDTNNQEKIIKLAGEVGVGINDYSTSTLQKIINNYYYNSLKYSGKKSYDFTSTGIKNDITRNMIANNNYSLLGWNGSSVYSDQMYNYERTTGSVYSSSYATSWTGKIAITYSSDYGYAADLGKCTKTLNYYSDSTCTSNNWMKSIMTSGGNWLLTPDSNFSFCMKYVGSDGNVNSLADVTFAESVIPVLFLNSDASVKSGTGTSSEPYQLNIN